MSGQNRLTKPLFRVSLKLTATLIRRLHGVAQVPQQRYLLIPV
jgi:hypothetical protein